MRLGDALLACAVQRGELFAREIGWKKMSNDATGYGQFVLGVWPKEVYKWLAWNTYEDKLTFGGTLRLDPGHLQKDWELVTLEELKKQAIESLNPLEKENYNRYHKEKTHA